MELLAATLTIEDLHWADPKTPDVLRGIAGRGALAPLFIGDKPGPSSALGHAGASHDSFARPAQARHDSGAVGRPCFAREVANNAHGGGAPLFVKEPTIGRRFLRVTI